MNAWTDGVGALGRLSLQAGVLVVFVGIVQWVFRRYLPPRWRCALWFLVVARLLLPASWKSDASLGHWLRHHATGPAPAASAAVDPPHVAAKDIPSPELPPPAVWSPTGVSKTPDRTPSQAPFPVASPVGMPPFPTLAPGNPLPSSTSGLESVPPPSVAASRPELSWGLVLTGLWALGVFVLLSYVVFASVRFRRQLTGYRAVTDPAVTELLRACEGLLGVRKLVTLQETPVVNGPALCGWWTPRLLLPPGLTTRLTPNELRFVFLHELAHVKRRDILLNWLLTALQILHWFNPLVWFAFHRLRVDCELACDALVLEHTGAATREDYGTTLLRLLADLRRGTQAPGLVGILENSRQLRQRITLIAEFTPRRRWPWLALALTTTLGWVGLTDPPAGSTGKEVPATQNASAHNLPVPVPFDLRPYLVEPENATWERDVVWTAVPRGETNLSGLPFRLDGLVQLHGQHAAAEGQTYRERISLRVPTRTWGSVHVLGGTAYSGLEAGTPVAELVWRYADGSFSRVPIRYGHHVRDWWRMRYEQPPRVTAPHAKVAWRGDHPTVGRHGKSRRLYRFTLGNPEPKKPVQWVEFYSHQTDPNLFLAALTLDPLTPEQRSDPAPDLEEVDPEMTGGLALLVTDAATGAGLNGVRVRLSGQYLIDGTNRTDFERTEITGDAGQVEAKLPGNVLEHLQLSLRHTNYGEVRMRWERALGDTIPATLTVALKPVVVLGGRVVDPAGQPVSGATVQVYRFWMGGDADRLPTGGKESLSFSSKYTTDSAGRWQSHDAPEEVLGRTGIRLEHPDFLPGMLPPVDQDPRVLAELRAGTHVWTLQPGLAVKGQVTDAQNQPLAQARVTIGRPNFQNIKSTETGPDGRFVIQDVEAGAQPISVQIKGFKAVARTTKVSATNEAEVHFVLAPGQPLRGRVVDPGGVPIPEVRVAHETHPFRPGLRQIEWRTVTDAEGRFEWDSAPEETLEFYFGAPGWTQRRGVKLAPRAEEHVITLQPPRRIVGKIVDAEEGQPIPEFKLHSAQGDAERLHRWSDTDQRSILDPKGEFELALGDEEHNVLRVEAEGYQRRLVMIPEDESPVIEMTIELTPDPGLTGIVVTPNGEPVAGAVVALCENDENGLVTLGRGLFKNDLGGFGSPSAKTGSDGHFQLRSLPNADRVIAMTVNGYGEASPAALRANGTLVLQPLGRIEGVLWSEGRPAAGVELLPLTSGCSPRLHFESYRVVTDPEGRFAWDRVPPGHLTIVRLVQASSQSWMYSHGKHVEVPPGETVVVELGRTGVTLNGRVRWNLPDHAPDSVFVSGRLRLLLPTPPSSGFSSTAEAETRQRQRFYAFVVQADGAFRLEGVEPGRYELKISAKDNTTGEVNFIQPPLALVRQPVDIEAGGSPLDLGELELKPVTSDLPWGIPAQPAKTEGRP